MYKKPRAATIVAKVPTCLWCMSRAEFHTINTYFKMYVRAKRAQRRARPPLKKARLRQKRLAGASEASKKKKALLLSVSRGRASAGCCYPSLIMARACAGCCYPSLIMGSLEEEGAAAIRLSWPSECGLLLSVSRGRASAGCCYPSLIMARACAGCCYPSLIMGSLEEEGAAAIRLS
jgi:hypothetical protein